MEYSRLNILNIKSWIIVLIISNKNIINKKNKIKISTNHKFQIKLINDIDNNEVIIIPTKILIDKRLESVKDWKKLEKDSNIKRNIERILFVLIIIITGKIEKIKIKINYITKHWC